MSVCGFEHNFPLLRPMRRLYKLYQLWDVIMCSFSLKDAFLHYFDLRGRLQVQIFTEEDVYVCNFSHTKSCQRSLVWPTRRTAMCIHCEKTSLCATFWLTWTCPHANFLMRVRVCRQVVPLFPMFGLDRHVSTQCVDYKTSSCARSHTKRPVSAHFVSNEVISMRNIKHMSPCWSPNFP